MPLVGAILLAVVAVVVTAITLNPAIGALTSTLGTTGATIVGGAIAGAAVGLVPVPSGSPGSSATAGIGAVGGADGTVPDPTGALASRAPRRRVRGRARCSWPMGNRR